MPEFETMNLNSNEGELEAASNHVVGVSPLANPMTEEQKTTYLEQ